MKELRQIIDKLDSMDDGESAVLATVVDVKGSSYRLPGAKMLILENGESCGTVSGGCLEADVMERAAQVLESGNAQIFTYDTTNNEDSVFSFNMGCRGVIRILLERIGNLSAIGKMLRSAYSDGESGEMQIMATVIAGDAEEIGSRVSFSELSGFEFHGVSESGFERFFLALDCEGFYFDRSRSPHTAEVTDGQEKLELFFDRISPPQELCIFGAGADAVPLAELAKSIGWQVTVVDHREALANNERFNDPDRIIISRPEEIDEKVEIAASGAAVVMTHNLDHDREIVADLIHRDIAYLGLLGPRVRTERILEQLRSSGRLGSNFDDGKLHAPIGLDIGAELPETIAVAIIAEIQATLASREGGFLRNRTGSIYGRNQ